MPIISFIGMHCSLGVCGMAKDFQNEKIVHEIKALIKGIDSAKDEVNVYCDLLKQLFLTNSSEN